MPIVLFPPVAVIVCSVVGLGVEFPRDHRVIPPAELQRVRAFRGDDAVVAITGDDRIIAEACHDCFAEIDRRIDVASRPRTCPCGCL